MTKDSSKRTSCRASVQPRPENALKPEYGIAVVVDKGKGILKNLRKTFRHLKRMASKMLL